MHGQQYRPGDRDYVLLPAVFCRECGQEYLCVRRSREDDGITRFLPRELDEQADDAVSDAGFLYFSLERPWPTATEEMFDRLASDWVETTNGIGRRLTTRRRNVPVQVTVGPNGTAR